LAEITQTSQSTVTNHYIWGLDLSQSLQDLPAATGAAQAGAGGIGGLLVMVSPLPWERVRVRN
jgi:hypothetical protein